jgi:hypothetical protein
MAMTVSAKWYGNARVHLLNGEINFAGTGVHTIKVMLCDSTYVPDQDTDEFKVDATNEITATGYTAGGVALTSVAVSYTGGTNVAKVDADDVLWADSTITARIAVIYDSHGGSDAADILLGYVDFGADVSSSAGDFSIDWSADGVFTDTAA